MLDRKGFPAKAAMICLAVSILCRGIGGLLDMTIFEDRFTFAEFLLPIACSVLLLLCIVAFGRKGFWTSVIPFVCLMMAFVLRLFTFDNLQQIELPLNMVLLSVFVCMILAALYAATVFGARTKWLLFLLLLTALGAHVWFEIIPAFTEGAGLALQPVFMEISVLFLFFSLIFVAVGLTRKHREAQQRPNHGKEPVAPPPADETGSRPPVTEEKTASSPEQGIQRPAPEPQKPEPAPEKEPVVPTVPAMSEMKPEPEVKKPEPEEEYDPFAPSKEPIKLTLNPVGFSVHTEDETRESGS